MNRLKYELTKANDTINRLSIALNTAETEIARLKNTITRYQKSSYRKLPSNIDIIESYMEVLLDAEEVIKTSDKKMGFGLLIDKCKIILDDTTSEPEFQRAVMNARSLRKSLNF